MRTLKSIFSFLGKREIYFSIILLLIFNNSLFAQVDSSYLDSIRVFDELVISVTRNEKDIASTGRSISIITREQIEQSAYTNVAELLSNREGIYIVGAGQNPGNTQSIFTRGSNSNHTLIMIDGVRITDPSGVNNASDLSELPFTSIERIEIVRGSHSSIYGTSAIGGVVNIITKKNTQPGLHGFAELKGGTFGKGTSLFQENLFLSYATKNGFYVNGNLINLNVVGQDATANLPVAPEVFDPQDKDDFKKLDGNIKVGFKNEKWDVFGGYRNTFQHADIDAGAFDDDDNAFTKFKRDHVIYGAAYKFSDKFNIQYSGGLSNMWRKVMNDSSLIDNLGNYDQMVSRDIYQGKVFVNDLLFNCKLKGFNGTLGLGNYYETMTSENSFYSPFYSDTSNLDTLDLKSSIRQIFLLTELNGSLLSEKLSSLSLILSGRLNQHNLFGTNFTYSINPTYKLNASSLLYFSYSTGFNAPSLYQLYSPSMFAKGNQKLKPEVSKTYEIGYKQYYRNMNFQISIFNTDVNDNIQFVYVEDSLTNMTTPTYINISKMNTAGFEVGVMGNVNDKVSVGGNFSAVNGKYKYSSANIDQTQTGPYTGISLNGQQITNKEITTIGLSRRPAYIANFSFAYKPIKQLQFSVTSRFVSSRQDAYFDPILFSVVNTTLENYSITDFQINYAITKNFSAVMRVENIFDKEYFEISGYNTRGRSAYLKLKYSF